MANRDWIKKKEAELVTQAEDMSAAISAAVADFGLLPADATALASDVTSWVNAYDLAKDVATRTPLTIEDKDVKKAAVIARMRSVGGRVRANPTVSNALKMSIGLHIADKNPTANPAPGTKPVTTVVRSEGRTVRCRIADELTPNLRRKPEFVTEYEVFTFVGETAPADLAAWSYQGQGTRNVFDVTLPNTVASGAKVWIVTRWCNRRGVAGPAADPVAAIVVGTVAEAA
jgi:hypothetical protein